MTAESNVSMALSKLVQPGNMVGAYDRSTGELEEQDSLQGQGSLVYIASLYGRPYLQIPKTKQTTPTHTFTERTNCEHWRTYFQKQSTGRGALDGKHCFVR